MTVYNTRFETSPKCELLNWPPRYFCTQVFQSTNKYKVGLIKKNVFHIYIENCLSHQNCFSFLVSMLLLYLLNLYKLVTSILYQSSLENENST